MHVILLSPAPLTTCDQYVWHSNTAGASYILVSVKMLMLQNIYLAWGDNVCIAIGQSKRVLTHATYAWHRSVDGVTDIGYICSQPWVLSKT